MQCCRPLKQADSSSSASPSVDVEEVCCCHLQPAMDQLLYEAFESALMLSFGCPCAVLLLLVALLCGACPGSSSASGVVMQQQTQPSSLGKGVPRSHALTIVQRAASESALTT